MKVRGKLKRCKENATGNHRKKKPGQGIAIDVQAAEVLFGKAILIIIETILHKMFPTHKSLCSIAI